MGCKCKKGNDESKKKFKSKHINHNPQAQSARAVFGKRELSQGDKNIGD